MFLFKITYKGKFIHGVSVIHFCRTVVGSPGGSSTRRGVSRAGTPIGRLLIPAPVSASDPHPPWPYRLGPCDPGDRRRPAGPPASAERGRARRAEVRVRTWVEGARRDATEGACRLSNRAGGSDGPRPTHCSG